MSVVLKHFLVDIDIFYHDNDIYRLALIETFWVIDSHVSPIDTDSDMMFDLTVEIQFIP